MTIVAYDGEDMNAGLAGVSRPFHCTTQPVVNTPNGPYMATTIDTIQFSPRNSPWGLRAWTCQEGVLSRRCLIFDRLHVSMRCQKEFFHDSMGIDKDESRELTLQSDSRLGDSCWNLEIREKVFHLKRFNAFVKTYSRRQLTLQSDALNACRGILNQFTQSTGVAFVWGIPVVNILPALSWTADPSDLIEPRIGFPSWTWLGWRGSIEYRTWLENAEDLTAQAHQRHEKWITESTMVQARSPEEAILREQIVHKPAAAVMMNGPREDDSSFRLSISSTTARFKLRMVYKHGPNMRFSFILKITRPVMMIGDHWTLLGNDGLPLKSFAGDHVTVTSLHETEYCFRAHPRISPLLMANGEEAEFLFLQYWPAVRGGTPSGEWLYDMVTALLIVRNEDQTAWRAACILLRLEDWIAAKPQPAVVTLV